MEIKDTNMDLWSWKGEILGDAENFGLRIYEEGYKTFLEAKLIYDGYEYIFHTEADVKKVED